MANVRLIHWNGPEGRERRLRLASLGHQVAFDDVDGPGLTKVLKRSLPDAYVIDLSRLPSGGRTVAMWLRTNKSTRYIPIVFVDGDPQKVEKIRQLLPDATYTSWPRLKTAVANAVATPMEDPVVPPSAIYTGRTTVDKLGFKPRMRICIAGAPAGFVETLRPLPKSVRFTARPAADCDLFLAFARTRRDLIGQFGSLAKYVTIQTLWIVWPKKSSGVATDLDGNFVRGTGLGSGWVDFKVCAVDATWSALAFKRRK